MNKFTLALAAVSVLTLSACVDQEQADVKMAKGCEGALQTQLGEGKTKDIKKTGGTAEVNTDGEFRKIEMTYVPADGFDETPQSATCLFSEQWGPAKSSHTALLEQLSVGGQIYGKQNGAVQGSLDDFLKLTDASSKAMGQQ